VPGGVESAQELRNAFAHDPVVAGHYADFNLGKARIVRLDRDRAVYVSYRLGDRIYWTKKKLELHRGESVITDGKNEARTRCGNRISDLPTDLVSPLEPTVEAMDGTLPPVLVAENEARMEFPAIPALALPAAAGSQPSGPTAGGLVPPVYFPIVGGGTSYPQSPYIPPGPPAATPEPDARALLGIALLALLAIGRMLRIRSQKGGERAHLRGD